MRITKNTITIIISIKMGLRKRRGCHRYHLGRFEMILMQKKKQVNMSLVLDELVLD